ncbi:hypothetical protein [Actinomadura kijaniata]|uniref:hypothetical protein n=1 Tax=Actinomadura kijaniata TaxID=46161 RepID=UPI00082954A9|nr:hypothetical protein [Actinomadura kijaniata]
MAASPHARVAPVVPGCLGYNGLDRHNPPAQVRAGRFAVPAPRRSPWRAAAAPTGGWTGRRPPAAGKARVDFVRVPLPGDGAETSPAQVVTGSRTPSRGWVATAHRTARPAPVVRLGGRGERVRMLTVIAPSREPKAARVRTRPSPNGGLRIETTVAGRPLTVEASPDGTPRRLS